MGILVKNALFNMSSNVKYYRRMKDNEEKGAFVGTWNFNVINCAVCSAACSGIFNQAPPMASEEKSCKKDTSHIGGAS